MANDSDILVYKLTMTLPSRSVPFSVEYMGATAVEVSSISMTWSLYGVSFRREMYVPGHIQAEILIETESNLDVETLRGMLVGASVSLQVGDTTVASGYFIHEITPQYTKQGETNFIYVKLDIFSPDKKMTMSRFSRAYLGRRLFSDIAKSGVDAFGINSEQYALQKLFYLGDEVENPITKKKEKEMVEMVQPYLVQYNETFHEFLSRVANRCGEVFYFEDGKLCFGIPKDAKTTSITDAERVVFQRYADDTLSIQDYARDSVKGKVTWDSDGSKKTDYTLSDDEIMTDPVARGDNGFPTDAYARLEKGSADYTHFYNAEVASDDQYVLLYKDKFARDSVSELWKGNGVGHTMGVVAQILESTSLLELVTKFAKKEIDNALSANAWAGGKNSDGAKNHLADGKNSTAVIPQAGMDLTKWLTLDYYHDIRVHEKDQMRKAVCVNMGEGFRNVKLGERITIPNAGSTTYVVTRIEMSSANPWKCDYGEFFGGETPRAVQSQRIYAIPMTSTTQNATTTYTFYPPLLTDRPFRQSGPQPAFVTHSGDPKGQGRVRVRFAWQASLFKEDQEVKDAESAKKKAGEDFETEEEKFLKKHEYIEDSSKDKLEWTYRRKDGGAVDSADENPFREARDKYRDAVKRYDAAVEKRAIEENATPWIRMTTPMATSGGGMYFQAEVGDEVMVDFENGNIERPFVSGVLYSKNVPVPQTGTRVITSKNGHTIKMNDPTDGSLLLQGMFPALSLLSTYGVKISGLSDKINEVLGGIEMTDKYGFYKIKMSSHERNITISSPFGDVKLNAFSGITINAPNGDISITGKNVSIKAYNKLSMSSGENIKLGLDQYHAGYLGSFLDGEKLGEAAGSIISSFYADLFDLSFIRSILEVFIRPVDGTFSIKSNRYLMMEAGKGTAVPAASNYKDWEDAGGDGLEAKNLVFAIPYIKETLYNYVETYFTLFNSVHNKLNIATPERGWSNEFEVPKSKLDILKSLFALDPAVLDKKSSFEAKYKEFIEDQTKWKYKDATSVLMRRIYNNSLKSLMRAVLELKKHHLLYLHMFDDLANGGVGAGKLSKVANFFRYGTVRYQQKGIPFEFDKILKMTKAAVVPPVPAPPATILKGTDVLGALGGARTGSVPAVVPDEVSASAADGGFYFQAYLAVEKYVTNSSPSDSLFDHELTVVGLDAWKKIVCRRLVASLITYCRTHADQFKTFKVTTDYPADTQIILPKTPFIDADWPGFVAGIAFEKKDGASASWGSQFLAGLAQGAILDPLSSLALFELGPWKSDAKNGQILLSDKEGVTYQFNANGATEKYDVQGRIEGDAVLVRTAMGLL